MALNTPKVHSTNELWICGFHPVRDAIQKQANLVLEMLCARESDKTRELILLAKERGIHVELKPFATLTSVTGHSHHQGVAVRLKEFPYAALDSFLERPLQEREPLLILDCIQDPQNFGAILRSASFFGVKGVIIPKDRAAQVSSAVVKVASGATSHLPIVRVTNLVSTVEELQESGLWIIGLDVHAGEILYETDLRVPLCLIVGNEQKGLRHLVRRKCDFLARIPGSGLIDSLNAAAAGAVALAEIQRQRRDIKV